MSAEQPWLKFFPTDWRADQGLRVVSLAARGLLFELMLLSTATRGPIRINGSVPARWQMASLVGVLEQDLQDPLDELLAAGLAVTEADGALSVPLLQEWRERHPERLPDAEWAALRLQVFVRDDFTCTYCGARGVRLECDHIIPLSRGGSDDLTNLTTACKPCNQAKYNRTPEEWKGS